VTKEALLAKLAQMVKRAGSQRGVAAMLGVSQAYLSDVLAGRREPGDKILTALNLKRVVRIRYEAA